MEGFYYPCVSSYSCASILLVACPSTLLLCFWLVLLDNHHDDDELFLWNVWPTKGFKLYFQSGPLSEILNFPNLWRAASSVWTCAKLEFRLSWMKLCSTGKHYTTSLFFSLAINIDHRFLLNTYTEFLILLHPIWVRFFWLIPVLMGLCSETVTSIIWTGYPNLMELYTRWAQL